MIKNDAFPIIILSGCGIFYDAISDTIAWGDRPINYRNSGFWAVILVGGLPVRSRRTFIGTSDVDCFEDNPI